MRVAELFVEPGYWLTLPAGAGVCYLDTNVGWKPDIADPSKPLPILRWAETKPRAAYDDALVEWWFQEEAPNEVSCEQARKWLIAVAKAHGANTIYYRQNWEKLAIDRHDGGSHFLGSYTVCMAVLVRTK